MEKIEADILAVEEQIKACTDPEERKMLRKKEEQLREKELILLRSNAVVAPPLPAGLAAEGTAAEILTEIRKQSKTSNALIRAFLATKKKKPISTASERIHHQEKFKTDSITRYNAQSDTSGNHILCSVLGEYIRRDEVTASHICGLIEQDALPALGKDSSFRWDPQNCVLMYSPLEKLYDSMLVTLLYDPENHQVTFQVLYDYLLKKNIVSDFSLFEGYATMSKTKQKKLRKRFQTYQDLDGKVLHLPSLALPSRTLLHWAAKSAYEDAMKSHVDHACAIASMPSKEKWEAIAKDISPSVSRLQSYLEDEDEDENLASDEEEGLASDDEGIDEDEN